MPNETKNVNDWNLYIDRFLCCCLRHNFHEIFAGVYMTPLSQTRQFYTKWRIDIKTNVITDSHALQISQKTKLEHWS